MVNVGVWWVHACGMVCVIQYMFCVCDCWFWNGEWCDWGDSPCTGSCHVYEGERSRAGRVCARVWYSAMQCVYVVLVG